jgi:hypothetical protein
LRSHWNYETACSACGANKTTKRELEKLKREREDNHERRSRRNRKVGEEERMHVRGAVKKFPEFFNIHSLVHQDFALLDWSFLPANFADVVGCISEEAA